MLDVFKVITRFLRRVQDVHGCIIYYQQVTRAKKKSEQGIGSF